MGIYVTAPAVPFVLLAPHVMLVRMSDLPPMQDLADRLFAAADDAGAFHHDLCAGRPDAPCSCGMPQLVLDLAVVMRTLGLARPDAEHA